MNDSVKYFLPSLIRGVYRFDERLSRIKTDEETQDFIETKLRFIPEQFIEIVREAVDLENVSFDETIAGKLLTVNSPQLHTQNKRRYQHYFALYRYFENQIEPKEGEQNYLESEFVRSILSPILSSEGLLKFQPQTTIKGFIADFTLEALHKYVFEVDGFGKFATRDSLDKFLNRQNVLVQDGWSVLRYSYSDIIENTERTRRKVLNLLKTDEQFRPFLLDDTRNSNRPSRGGLFELIHRPKEPKEPSYDIIDLVNDFFLIQDYCTTVLTAQPPESTEVICLEDRLPYPFPIVAFALTDLYYSLNCVEQLFELRFNLRPLRLTCKHFDEKYARLLHPLITVQTQTEEAVDSISIRPDNLLTFLSPITLPSLVDTSFNYSSNLGVETIREHLSYITQSMFRYANGTKPHQERVLKSIFDYRDVLGIFPTGSGKSFCFWLAALLKPGLSIVICPLRSLMRDQRLTLENYGIASVDFINSDVKKDERIRIINDAKLGKLKLLYVAPERIRIKDFIEDLKAIQHFVNINYLIIDEAHCISEWGHDFRPSYLNIPFFYTQLKERNRNIQLISLTATAGQMVRRDIVNLLSLKAENVLTEKDLDRIHFSYQIEPLDGYNNKANKFDELLTESIPIALSRYLALNPNQSDIHAVVNSQNKRREKGIGIIYVVYADPHGKHSTVDGLAHYLYTTKKIIEPETFQGQTGRRRRATDLIHDHSLESYATGKVRAFSSKPPTLCPQCYSYKYVSQKKIDDESDFELDENVDVPEKQPGRKVCLDCGHEFLADDAVSPSNYSALTQQNQIDFKRGNFDILVATKGFGMGIDKSSVRFVLHTTPSSSIESWYQEIGRAGRDEERAHCAAIADTPNEPCLRELRASDKKIPRCNWKAGCPHGKNGLCDYGKQHVFIKHSYTGVVTDVISAVRTLDKLITSFVEGSAESIQFRTSHAYLKYHELALFRLKLLGMVEDFSVTYGGLTVHFDVSLRTQQTKEGKLTIWTGANEIKDRLKSHLEKNKLYHEIIGTIEDRIRECKQKYDTDILEKLDKQDLKQYQKYRGFYHTIIDYLLVLLDHTYENIVRMRYDMLWNLYEDVILNEKHCRRKSILDYIAEKGFLEENYRCGLCDNCVDDLDFSTDSRIAPTKTEKMDELEHELERVFGSVKFEYDYLVTLKDAFREYPTSTYRKARAILEGSPKNLVALYFTREFSPKNEEEANAIRLLETANRALDLDTVIRLYESSRPQYKSKLLLLLNDEYGQFNNVKGILWLFSKASAELEKTHNEDIYLMRETLRVLIVCDEMNDNFSNRLTTIKQELEKAYYG